MDVNSAAIATFYETEQPKLVNFVKKRLKNAGERDAEDIVQDVMLAFLNNIDPLKPIENIAGYFYQSLKNRIVDHYRRRKGEIVSFDEALDEMGGNTLADILADVRYDTYGEFEKKMVMESIFKAVDRLKPDQKAVWIATEIDEYTFEELSLFWNEPIGTLLARKHRAVIELRKRLKDLMV